MSITYNELLHGHLISDVPLTHQHHLEELLVAVNKLRVLWNKPMIVTSGWRSPQEQMQINPKAPHSNHCLGYAVDVGDPDGSLYAFVEDLDHNNQQVLKDMGLWFEAGTNTRGIHSWLHIQCVAYGSYRDGKSRFFNP